jgi:hypothetical protein
MGRLLPSPFDLDAADPNDGVLAAGVVRWLFILPTLRCHGGTCMSGASKCRDPRVETNEPLLACGLT